MRIHNSSAVNAWCCSLISQSSAQTSHRPTDQLMERTIHWSMEDGNWHADQHHSLCFAIKPIRGAAHSQTPSVLIGKVGTKCWPWSDNNHLQNFKHKLLLNDTRMEAGVRSVTQPAPLLNTSIQHPQHLLIIYLDGDEADGTLLFSGWHTTTLGHNGDIIPPTKNAVHQCRAAGNTGTLLIQLVHRCCRESPLFANYEPVHCVTAHNTHINHLGHETQRYNRWFALKPQIL